MIEWEDIASGLSKPPARERIEEAASSAFAVKAVGLEARLKFLAAEVAELLASVQAMKAPTAK